MLKNLYNRLKGYELINLRVVSDEMAKEQLSKNRNYWKALKDLVRRMFQTERTKSAKTLRW